MASIFDRLAQGPGALQPNDYNDWNQMVGSAPPDKFGNATANAVRQVDPQDYYRHTQPGVDNTDPLGTLQPQQRQGIAQSILGALSGLGIGPQQVSQGAGVGQLDPSRMSPEELAALAQWVQRNHPEVMGQVASQYRSQPDIISGLLGNKALMLALAGIGAKILADRASQRQR